MIACCLFITILKINAFLSVCTKHKKNENERRRKKC